MLSYRNTYKESIGSKIVYTPSIFLYVSTSPSFESNGLTWLIQLVHPSMQLYRGVVWVLGVAVPTGGVSVGTPGDPEGGDSVGCPGDPEGGDSVGCPGDPEGGVSVGCPGDSEGGVSVGCPGDPEGGVSVDVQASVQYSRTS